MIHEELSGKIIRGRNEMCLGTEEDNLRRKHTKHPKEEKPVFPLLVSFRVCGEQISRLLQRLRDPEWIKSMSRML